METFCLNNFKRNYLLVTEIIHFLAANILLLHYFKLPFLFSPKAKGAVMCASSKEESGAGQNHLHLLVRKTLFILLKEPTQATETQKHRHLLDSKKVILS